MSDIRYKIYRPDIGKADPDPQAYAYRLLLEGGLDTLMIVPNEGDNFIINDIEWSACEYYQDEEGYEWVYDRFNDCWYSGALDKVVPDETVPVYLREGVDEEDRDWRQYTKESPNLHPHKLRSQDLLQMKYMAMYDNGNYDEYCL